MFKASALIFLPLRGYIHNPNLLLCRERNFGKRSFGLTNSSLESIILDSLLAIFRKNLSPRICWIPFSAEIFQPPFSIFVPFSFHKFSYSFCRFNIFNVNLMSDIVPLQFERITAVASLSVNEFSHLPFKSAKGINLVLNAGGGTRTHEGLCQRILSLDAYAPPPVVASPALA